MMNNIGLERQKGAKSKNEIRGNEGGRGKKGDSLMSIWHVQRGRNTDQR